MFLKTSILFLILVIFCSGLDLGVTEKWEDWEEVNITVVFLAELKTAGLTALVKNKVLWNKFDDRPEHLICGIKKTGSSILHNMEFFCQELQLQECLICQG